MRFVLRSLVALVLLCLTLGLVGIGMVQIVQSRSADDAGGRPRGASGRERTFAVSLEQITRHTADPVISSYGEVEGARVLELRAAAGGVLTDLAADFRNGAAVAQGDLLFEIDPADATAARNRAAAAVQEASAALSQAIATRELADDELAAAVSQRTLRAAALERQRGLEQRGVGTSITTETAELALSQAEQTVLTRRQAMLSQDAAIDRAEIELTRARIDLEEAERTLADTRYLAPFDGLLTNVTAVPGRRVSQNEQLAVLIDPTVLEVAFQVTTAQFARLLDAEGALTRAAVTVSLDLDGVPFVVPGRIVRSGAEVAAGQTGRQLYAALDLEGGAVLRPGDFVAIAISEPALTDVSTVPAAALTSANELLIAGPDDRLQAFAVEVLRRQGDEVIIADAPVGARYVVEVRPQLGPGVAITPIVSQAEEEQSAVELPRTISLDPERRARLRAFVEGNTAMPADVRARTLSALEAEEVPRATVERLEQRMGG